MLISFRDRWQPRNELPSCLRKEKVYNWRIGISGRVNIIIIHCEQLLGLSYFYILPTLRFDVPNSVRWFVPIFWLQIAWYLSWAHRAGFRTKFFLTCAYIYRIFGNMNLEPKCFDTLSVLLQIPGQGKPSCRTRQANSSQGKAKPNMCKTFNIYRDRRWLRAV